MLVVVRRLVVGAAACLLVTNAWAADNLAAAAKAAQLNNLGVAYMNQQRMDKAVEQFDMAMKADPSLADRELEQGHRTAEFAKAARGRRALDAAAATGP